MRLSANSTQMPKNAWSTLAAITKTPGLEQSLPTTVDSTEFHMDGIRPAPRNVKKIAKGIAAGIGVAGLAKTAFDIAKAPSIQQGLLHAAADLAMTGAAIVGLDLASGVAHHWGDNYGLPTPKPFAHTKWHTDVRDTGYCLVGLSNKALDKVEFWPKWEKAIHTVTGKTPLSWQVEPYHQYAIGNETKLDLEQMFKLADQHSNLAPKQ